MVLFADILSRPLPPVVPQPDFVACAVAAIVSDRRRRARVRATGGLLTLAAAVAVAVTLTARRPADHSPKDMVQVSPPALLPPIVPPIDAADPVPKVGDVMAGAGASLAALSSRVVDGAPSLPGTPTAMSAATPAPDLGHVPAAARAGFEPLAAGTRRAAYLFLRDAGLAPKEKS